MSKRKNKFKNTWKKQKELGLIYGKSAIAVGKALNDLGLRDPITKIPTDAALEDRIAIAAHLKDGTSFYLWHKQLTCHKLNTIPSWQQQSSIDRQCQTWASDYAAAINASLRSSENEAHHLIVDSSYDWATDISRLVIKAGKDAIDKINDRLRTKIPPKYLIKTQKIAQQQHEN